MRDDGLPEVDQPPDGWVTTTVRDVVAVLQYGVSTKAEPDAQHGVPILRMGNIQDGRLDLSDLKYVRRTADLKAVRLSKGDILFNRTNSPELVGKAAVVDVDEELVFASYLIRLTAVAGTIEPQYLCWWINSSWGRRWAAAVRTDGVSQSNINGTKLAEMPLPLPPFPEQRRIVEKVEALLADVNAARDRLAKVPLILKRFRQAVLAAACSGRLTEEWRGAHSAKEDGKSILARIWAARRQRADQGSDDRPRSGTLKERPFKGDWDLYELPPEWAWTQWDDLADWITYGFTRPMPHVNAGVPIVTARHVLGSRIDFATSDLTTNSAFAELSEKDRPREGEILLTKDGSIGRAAVVRTNEQFCINQSVAVIRFGGMSLNPEYLLRVIEAPWTQHLIDEGAKGSAIRHISITAFGHFPVPVPPVDEQAEIVRCVEALFGLADAIEARVKVATARADKLPQAFLSKAFKGELVPTEAELARAEGRKYETAAEMLARIKAAAPVGKAAKKPSGKQVRASK